MKPKTFREIIEILEAHGFVRDRVTGSHAQYKGSFGGRTRIVTVQIGHLSDQPTRTTFSSIMRQSGLPKDRFR